MSVCNMSVLHLNFFFCAANLFIIIAALSCHFELFWPGSSFPSNVGKPKK